MSDPCQIATCIELFGVDLELIGHLLVTGSRGAALIVLQEGNMSTGEACGGSWVVTSCWVALAHSAAFDQPGIGTSTRSATFTTRPEAHSQAGSLPAREVTRL